jgi:WD40 repeat protein
VYRTADFKLIVSHDLNKFGKRNVIDQKQNWIQIVKYSPTGRTVAVGSHGFVIVLCDVADGYKPKHALTAHNASITQLDWSIDGKLIQANDNAYELLFHDVDEKDYKNSAQHTSPTDIRDTKWASQTCILGWPVQGIFDPTQDGTDVNCVDASPSRTLTVTGDDYGNVNLYRYPVAAEGNKFKAFEGHSSHVVNTRFTPDEKWVVSVGGNDRGILVWKLV